MRDRYADRLTKGFLCSLGSVEIYQVEAQFFHGFPRLKGRNPLLETLVSYPYVHSSRELLRT